MLKLLSKLLCELEDVNIIALAIGGLILVVCILRISLWLNPPKTIDEKWTSRSVTGWTNTPKKLAWARVFEKEAQ